MSGATYTVYVSSSNDITDQVPDAEFSTIAASVKGTTLGGYNNMHLYTLYIIFITDNCGSAHKVYYRRA